ncbi:serine/threonine-protein phosphatase 4 regulatory subunit 1-like [Uloborus diversus]|uniref:serine/threonine-protein phosphatase 4 regulatory subunit 1-like n=1 Tax=Uloborus diversus TaxID=327109 RepID=UPI00240A87E2|nr:serine/threonine-protein phosphatase 4 regulatory subunit 1-like [Uloborus diversus]
MANRISEEKDTADEELDLSNELDFLLNLNSDDVEKKQKGRRIGKYDEQKEERDCHDQGVKSSEEGRAKDLQSKIFLDFFIEYDSVDLDKLNVDTFADRCFSLLETLAVSELATDRQLAVEKLLQYLSLVDKSEEKIDKTLPIFCSLSEDKELSVRCWFIDMIPQLVSFCKENRPYAGNVVKQVLVPYALKCFTATQLLVRQVGHASLNTLMENNLIENSQLSEWVCPFVAQCIVAPDNSIEVQREDLSFMNKILLFIGREMTVKFFLDPFVSMCAKADKYIRKVCASNFLTYAHFVGEGLTDSPLLLSFINLCNDHENVDVCLPCIEVLAEVSKLVSMEIRKELLTNVFMHLIESDNATITKFASQELGKFISTFATSSDYKLDPSGQTRSIDKSLEESSFKTFETAKGVFLTCNKSSSANVLNTLNCNLNFPSYVKENYVSGGTNSSFSNKMHGVLQNELIKCKQKDLNENLPSNMDLTEIESVLSTFSDTEGASATISNFEENINGVNNVNVFNNFQYWKYPLPEVELELKDHLQNDSTERKLKFSKSEAKLKLKISTISQFVDQVDHSDSVQKTEAVSDVDSQCTDPCTQTFRSRSYMMINQRHKPLRKKIRNLAESQDIIPPVLLDLYLKLCHKREFEEHCARSFPAVAYTVGKKHWFIVRDACVHFLYSGATIRKIMATSFHELVMIVDQEIFNKDLLPFFKEFLVDCDEVRDKVVEHLSDIVQHGGDSARIAFSTAMKSGTLECCGRNWRFEFTLAKQLSSIIMLFDTKEVSRIYLPFALDLLKNKISVIRHAAVELLAIILKHLLTDKATLDFVARTLHNLVENYKNAQKWNRRQLYVDFSEQIAIKQSLSMDMYVEKIVPHLLALARDSVPNVRLSVARSFARSLVPLGYFVSMQSSHSLLLTQVLFSLQNDIERDVRSFAVLVPATSINSTKQEARDC